MRSRWKEWREQGKTSPWTEVYRRSTSSSGLWRLRLCSSCVMEVFHPGSRASFPDSKRDKRFSICFIMSCKSIRTNKIVYWWMRCKCLWLWIEAVALANCGNCCCLQWSRRSAQRKEWWLLPHKTQRKSHWIYSFIQVRMTIFLLHYHNISFVNNI